MFKKFAVTMTTAAMIAASTVTAMAATSTYFYVYENGTFQAARMGQDCVKSVDVDVDDVAMYLQTGSYGSFTGAITNAWVDSNGNGTYDDDEKQLYDADENAIIYDQSTLSTTVDGESYANFYIQVTIKSNGVTVMEKTQNTFVPMQ